MSRDYGLHPTRFQRFKRNVWTWWDMYLVTHPRVSKAWKWLTRWPNLQTHWTIFRIEQKIKGLLKSTRKSLEQ